MIVHKARSGEIALVPCVVVTEFRRSLALRFGDAGTITAKCEASNRRKVLPAADESQAAHLANTDDRCRDTIPFWLLISD
jgi:hypothetical protein